MTFSICANGFLNCTQIIGTVIGEATNQTTGSLILTFATVMIILITFGMMFGIKMEYICIVIMPLMLGLMAQYKDFIALGAVILIYLSIILTKNFILK